ncbi:MAG: hypothetical protein OJF51_001149 [Nitrospira sp.]|nr:MAG: hypothetical protein OJF51_001149 [Nitrospira sp.]
MTRQNSSFLNGKLPNRPTSRPQYQATEELGTANLALPRWCVAILLRNQ